MSANYCVDFEAASNEDFRHAFVFTSASGDPADLTGATFRMSVKRHEGDEVLELSTANGRIAVTLQSARIDLIVPAADMAALTPGFHLHDLVMMQGGAVTRVWAGGLALAQGITQ